MKKALSLLLALALVCAVAPVALASNSTFTLMVYLCGTDLESDGGMASSDLYEMISGGVPVGGAVNVCVQTGGTKEWQTKGLADQKAERWLLDEEGMAKLDSLGKANMGAQETLASFLEFGFENYPADRYGLILWDHGSGATGGVCYDELTGDSLSMTEIYGALQSATKGQKFAFIGFDACLMATFEMANHLQPFAEYMIASEELEPGHGWDYASWLEQLADDPGVEIERLGRTVVDAFISSVESDDYGTLSVINLDELDALRSALEELAGSLTGEIDAGNLTAISRTRQNIRSFGEVSNGASDMIDVTLFADAFSKFNSKAAKNVKSALKKVVTYSRHTPNLSDISGMSVLVPYATREYASDYMSDYDSMDLYPQYASFVRGLLDQMSASSGGFTFWSTGIQQEDVQQAQVDWFSQYAENTDSYYESYESSADSDGFSLGGFLNDLFSSGTTEFCAGGSSLWGDVEGYDYDYDLNSSSGSSSFSSLWDGLQQDDGSISIQTQDSTVSVDNPFANTGSDYAYTASLSAEEMNYLAKVEANLMMDLSDEDFECYVELGYVQDVHVDWNAGKVYGLFNGTWPTLNGQMVCVYDQVANENYVRSLIPVKRNGEETYLLVVFDSEHTGGAVVGASEGYTDDGIPVRGYDKLEEGDVVVPQYELLYWDENDEMQSEPFEGDEIIVGADGSIPFCYDAVESDADYTYGFCLNDIFGGYQFTDFITLSY